MGSATLCDADKKDVILLQLLDAFFYVRDDIPVFRDTASGLIQNNCVGRNLTDSRQRLSKQKATELFLMGYRDVLPGFMTGFKQLVDNPDFTVRPQQDLYPVTQPACQPDFPRRLS